MFHRSNHLHSFPSAPCSHMNHVSIRVSQTMICLLYWLSDRMTSFHADLSSRTAESVRHCSEPSQINLAEKNVTSQGAEQVSYYREIAYCAGGRWLDTLGWQQQEFGWAYHREFARLRTDRWWGTNPVWRLQRVSSDFPPGIMKRSSDIRLATVVVFPHWISTLAHGIDVESSGCGWLAWFSWCQLWATIPMSMTNPLCDVFVVCHS